MFGALAPLARAASWDRKAFPEWDADLRDKLLTDSPWARQLTVPLHFVLPQRLRTDFNQIPGVGRAFPSGDGAVRTEAYLIVRWASALPIRQAMALERWGREALGRPEVAEALKTDPKDYVLEIAGFPAISIPQGAAWLETELAKSTTLLVPGRRPLTPTEVMVPAHGSHLMAEIRFSRAAPISMESGTVEVAATAGTMKIAAKFRLKDMVYRGSLEL